MADVNVPLQRLLDRAAVQALFATFAKVLPGSELALFDLEGRLFVGENRAAAWVDPGISSSETEAGAANQAGICVQPLVVQDRHLANLAGRGPICEVGLQALEQSLILILDAGLKTREVARETLDRYREINLLYRIGETIGACLDPEGIPRLELQEAQGVLRADLGLVLLPPVEGDGALTIKASFGDRAQVEAFHESARPLIDYVLGSGRPDIADLGSTIALCTPLRLQDRVSGVTLLGRESGQGMFTAGDEKLAMALAEQTGIALERSWLHKREVARQRLEQELAVGKRIQLSLLPRACPRMPGWDFAATYRAAEEVGGDFYGFFNIPGKGSRLGLAIGDITGKGIPAALMMAYARAVLGTLAINGRTPVAVLRRTNEMLIHDSFSQLLLTVFYAVLDPQTGLMRCASGGHDRPLWWHARTRTCSDLQVRGMLLGAFPDIKIGEHEVQIEPGDLLVLYTDGVTDVRNAAGKFFSLESLRAVVTANAGCTAQELVDRIAQAVHEFAGSMPLPDDFTLVVIRRQPEAEA